MLTMLRNTLRAAALGGGAWLLAASALSAASSAPRPNILLLMADDLGYADLSVHGATDFQTPNLDRLAKSGVRFTDAYVTGPVCGPSRAGLITGRNQARFGFQGHPGPGDTWGLPVEETTLSRVLQEAGYRTAIFGKWHLGEPKRYQPLQRGFDEFYGFLSGMHDYFQADDPRWGPIVKGNAEPAELDEYLTFELADRTIDFIERSGTRDAPFFAWLSFNAPHTPLQAPDDYLAQTDHLEGPRRPTYAAMVMAMDDAVGEVLDALEASGQARDTLVVFLSDNGGAMLEGGAINGASNAPLRGSKAQLWEGGIRVPFFMAWPGRIEPGRVSDQIVSTLDLFPTFARLAGARTPDDLEGVDLAPALFPGAEGQIPPRQLFWRFYGTNRAVRDEALKWTQVERQGGLFNLELDPGESADRSEASPEALQRLQRDWREWHEDNAKVPLSQRAGAAE